MGFLAFVLIAMVFAMWFSGRETQSPQHAKTVAPATKSEPEEQTSREMVRDAASSIDSAPPRLMELRGSLAHRR